LPPKNAAEVYFAENLRLAELGDPAAQFRVAAQFHWGYGTLLSDLQATLWAERSARQGYVSAQGYCALKQKGIGQPEDLENGVKWLRAGALNGVQEACIFFGGCFEFGCGMPVDFSEAVRWYQLAANKGHAVAQCFLGVCFRRGNGVPHSDVQKAVNLYQLALDQGFALAQHALADCCMHGIGVPCDLERAYLLWCLAAAQGLAVAQFCLGEMHYFGYVPGKPQNLTEAVMWYRLAAAQGEVKAQRNLGDFYETGMGISPDYGEALKWYQMAAAQNDDFAQYSLGEFYEKDHEGFPQDPPLAIAWYQKAAQHASFEVKANEAITRLTSSTHLWAESNFFKVFLS
jgi:TPR repeat protein